MDTNYILFIMENLKALHVTWEVQVLSATGKIIFTYIKYINICMCILYIIQSQCTATITIIWFPPPKKKSIRLGLGLRCLSHFQQYFSHIVAVLTVGTFSKSNRKNRRKRQIRKTYHRDAWALNFLPRYMYFNE